jgi:hypothetical protein
VPIAKPESSINVTRLGQNRAAKGKFQRAGRLGERKDTSTVRPGFDVNDLLKDSASAYLVSETSRRPFGFRICTEFEGFGGLPLDDRPANQYLVSRVFKSPKYPIPENSTRSSLS